MTRFWLPSWLNSMTVLYVLLQTRSNRGSLRLPYRAVSLFLYFIILLLYIYFLSYGVGNIEDFCVCDLSIFTWITVLINYFFFFRSFIRKREMFDVDYCALEGTKLEVVWLLIPGSVNIVHRKLPTRNNEDVFRSVYLVVTGWDGYRTNIFWWLKPSDKSLAVSGFLLCISISFKTWSVQDKLKSPA